MKVYRGLILYSEPKKWRDKFFKWFCRWTIRLVQYRNIRLRRTIAKERSELVKTLHIDPVYRLRELFIEDMQARLKENDQKLAELQGLYVNMFITPFKKRIKL